MPTAIARPIAILILITAATMFAGNHVAARLAFDDGTGLLLAILARGGVALLIMTVLALWQGHRFRVPAGKRGWQVLLGLMIAGQSLCLYSAVARVPVAVALLVMNTWPILLVLLNWAITRRPPSWRLVSIMALILAGVVLVLDVPAWLADPAGMGPNWLPGVAFALAAACFFTVAMWTTDHRLAGMPGSVRSVFTMFTVLIVMVFGGLFSLVPGGLDVPTATQGWVGLALLALLYGTGSTLLFVLAPRLDMARNAPVVNFEPVASLILGFIVLGQTLSPLQLLGGAVVICGIVWLSLVREL
ncbi:DMT family transporter [Saccharospirillum mangrovi]|uniref:DMT family transporter n=1 Tax=Saccharospirillum mangrovi TaxID=2161747 RepID=UPI000D33D96C|nr:DMT family transporter [Saccharospirillum mangrovi]